MGTISIPLKHIKLIQAPPHIHCDGSHKRLSVLLSLVPSTHLSQRVSEDGVQKIYCPSVHEAYRKKLAVCGLGQLTFSVENNFGGFHAFGVVKPHESIKVGCPRSGKSCPKRSRIYCSSRSTINCSHACQQLLLEVFPILRRDRSIVNIEVYNYSSLIVNEDVQF